MDDSNIFLTLLTGLYGISGVISMIAYLPTIKDLLKGIPSANFYTYSLRFLYYLIAVLYGIFVVKDRVFTGLASLDSVILLVIITLILRLKHFQKKRLHEQLAENEQQILEKVKEHEAEKIKETLFKRNFPKK